MVGRSWLACGADLYWFEGVSDLVPGAPGCTLVISGGRDAIDEGGESS
jgi:hypothetical protein